MNPQRKKKLLTLLTVLATIAVGVSLVAYGLRENLDHFFTPSEFVAGKPKQGQKIKVGGLVKDGSVIHDQDTLKVTFVITDKVADVTTEYNGILPDLFREGQGIVAHGIYTGQNRFLADKVIAKHDEKYMPPEAAEALMKASQTQQ